jgi:hypothetical protein
LIRNGLLFASLLVMEICAVRDPLDAGKNPTEKVVTAPAAKELLVGGVRENSALFGPDLATTILLKTALPVFRKV